MHLAHGGAILVEIDFRKIPWLAFIYVRVPNKFRDAFLDTVKRGKRPPAALQKRIAGYEAGRDKLDKAITEHYDTHKNKSVPHNLVAEWTKLDAEHSVLFDEIQQLYAK